MKVVSLFAALALLATTSSANAIGSSGSSLDPAPVAKPKPKPKSAKKIACKRNQTAKLVKRKWTCVTLKVGALEDYDLYQQARLLAEDGEYEWALDHLRVIRQKQNHEVLTYTGYANRKAGRLETGINYYQQALAVKPDFVEAREYLGEAYTLVGMTDQAQTQLQLIEGICGTTCEAFVKLDQFIKMQSTVEN